MASTQKNNKTYSVQIMVQDQVSTLLVECQSVQILDSGDACFSGENNTLLAAFSPHVFLAAFEVDPETAEPTSVIELASEDEDETGEDEDDLSDEIPLG